ncbi:MAG: hypothetical protein AAF558_06545 [Verrucomicrobiota bacterium]
MHNVANPEPSKVSELKKRYPKIITSMALVVSIAVHFSIFLVVGSVVIFKGAIQPDFFEATSGSPIEDAPPLDDIEAPPVLEEVEPELVEVSLEDSLEQPEIELSAASAADIIVSSAIDSPFVSAFSITGSTLSNGPIGVGNKVPKFKSAGGGGPGASKAASIFGRQIIASKFGAVLDISNSTHETIDVAIREIQQGFPGAIMVLAPGCGMESKQTGQIIEGQDFEDNIDQYRSTYDIAFHHYTAGFLKKLLKENSRFEKLWQSAKRDGRGYVLHLDLGKPVPYKNKTRSLAVLGTQHAFDFLATQGCDVIYWMTRIP